MNNSIGDHQVRTRTQSIRQDFQKWEAEQRLISVRMAMVYSRRGKLVTLSCFVLQSVHGLFVNKQKRFVSARYTENPPLCSAFWLAICGVVAQV